MFAWEQRKLNEFLKTSKLKNENNKFTRKDVLSVSGDYGIVNQIKFKGRSFAGASVQKYRIVNTNDVVYTKSPLKNNPYGIIKANKGNPGIVSTLYAVYKINEKVNASFIEYYFENDYRLNTYLKPLVNKGAKNDMKVSDDNALIGNVIFPLEYSEQIKIVKFLNRFDTLIALHQRKPFIKNGGIKMITSNFTCDSLFKDYFEFWIKLYKEGAVRPVTLEKYRNNQKHITKIIPNLKMKDFDRNAYQELLNQYALTHERQTVIDFHHQVKGAILDAVDDGLIDRDPTRKAIFKGKAPREKKQKYLNQFELHNLLEDLDLGMEITWDWLILLIAKTGLRFSEALGLTPADFDFARQTISVNKTWDYKTNTGFQPTKNRSSIRKVQMDWQLGMQFQHLIKNLNEDEPIFVNGPVCNSTPNNCLARHCRKCGIPEISIHGLRHTHASLLMFAGVSIASVSRRLGHSSITTTQKVYMHIISELENQDNDLVMRYLSSLS